MIRRINSLLPLALVSALMVPVTAPAQVFTPQPQAVPVQGLPQASREEQTVGDAALVLKEIMEVPAQQIPEHLLKNAYGIAIIPGVVKGGFVVGVRHGRGVVLVRDEQSNWQAPIFVSLNGGSVGWQVGLQSTDVILVFKSAKSVNGIMNGKLTIGVDAAAAAGPVGRNAAAATDSRLQAEILSYSRSRGLFAGVSIDGSSIQVDRQAGATYYQQFQVGPAGQVVQTQGTVPPSAVQLVTLLTSYTGGTVPGVNGVPQAVLPATLPGEVNVDLGEASIAPSAPVAVAQQPAYAANASRSALSVSLAASHLRLSKLVDPAWQKFLALPPVTAQNMQYDGEAMAQTLKRYDQAAADARYQALTTQPEFVETHRLLRDYVALRASQSSVIELPPPPTP